MKYQIRVVSTASVKPKLEVSAETFDEIVDTLKQLEIGNDGSVVGYYIQKVEEVEEKTTSN